MEPQRWEQVDRIFQAAVERDPGERAAFLDQACSGDETLRRAVDALLASDRDGWPLLDAPAFEAALGLLSDDAPELHEGDHVGRYTVLRLLGAGGMGEVYLAEDTALERRIALKILPATIAASESRLQRFQREARAASALNHPNIVTIHEISQFEGRHFIATEFVEGETLRQRLERGRLIIGQALDIAVQVAGALAAAHKAGIVHRDVKPDNIMIRSDGWVKVLDFGLAKLTAQAARPTRDGGGGRDASDASSAVLMGTIKYMSPEQTSGMAVDPRSDIFSFGVVLYEMTTGRRPFEGATTDDVIEAIRAQEPAGPAGHAPGAPPELEAIISKCIAKARNDRYQTFEEVLAALTEQQRTLRPPEAPSGWNPLGLFARHRRLTALGIVAALAVGVVSIRTWMKLAEPPRAPFETFELSRVLDTERSKLVSIAPDGKFICYVASPVDSPRESLQRREAATNTTAVLVPAADVTYYGVTVTPDGTHVYYAREEQGRWALFRVSVLGGASEKIMDGVRSAAAFSPDGRRLACVRVSEKEVALIVANADGTAARTLRAYQRTTPPGASISIDGLVWSPDGRAVASSFIGPWAAERRWGAVEIQVNDGSERPLTPLRWSYVGQLARLPKGAGMIMIAGDAVHGSQVWHLANPQGEPKRLTNDLNNYDSISVTRDGRTMAASTWERRSSVWTAAAQGAADASPIGSGTGHSLTQVVWAADGGVLFASSASGSREIWRMNADGTDRRRLSGDNSYSIMPAASPDGRYIVYASDRAGARNIWRMDADGRNPVQLNHDGVDFCLDPHVSPDGRWVVYTAGVAGMSTIRRVPIDGGDSVQLTTDFSRLAGVSPDGRWVACSYRASSETRPTMAVIPFDGGRPVRIFDVALTHPVRWTSDGRALVYVVTRSGVSNIWMQPVAGGPPKQLTRFTSESITGFDWSRDDRLVVARLTMPREIVLIKDR